MTVICKDVRLLEVLQYLPPYPPFRAPWRMFNLLLYTLALEEFRGDRGRERQEWRLQGRGPVQGQVSENTQGSLSWPWEATESSEQDRGQRMSV